MIDETLEGGLRDVPCADDLRHEVARVLVARTDLIVKNTVSLFPFSTTQPLALDACRRLDSILLHLLATAIHVGRLDARDQTVADLHRLAIESGLSVESLFAFLYLTERSALDQLALDDRVGAVSEPWPFASQLLRRASFDVMAAFTTRVQQEPSAAAIIDPLTTLYTRAMMTAVLASLLRHAERAGRPIVLMVLDVDRLSEINQLYGYGVGDRILERMGIQIRSYLRQEDWVFRHADDSIAVLLSETPPADAAELARRLLDMVEERLGFLDHRTQERVPVTISAAVVTAQAPATEPLDPQRLLFEAEVALERAKRVGRSSVECAEILPKVLSVEVAARYLDGSVATVQGLIASGAIATADSDPLYVERQSVMEYLRKKGLGPRP